MTLKDLVNEFKEDRIVLDQLFKLYPDQQKSERGYLNVLKTLRRLEPKENNLIIEIVNVKDDDGDYWHVSGYDPKDKFTYGIEFEPWDSWLGMKIRNVTFKQMSMLDAYCHCLWEMTWDGFTQEDIQATIDELNRRVSDVKSGKAKTVPLEDVIKKFDTKKED